jgi:hypothetical protein
LQKGSTLFKIKGTNLVGVEEIVEVQDTPMEKVFFLEDVVDDVVVPDGDKEIVVENLDDVLKWDMPDVDDIDMPEEEDNSDFDTSVTYHATITNLSDFDWCSFKAICYSSADSAKQEVKDIGNVKIGAKTLLSSRYDMFYLEGEDAYGTKRRFRPFIIEKDSDITITTIFAERG